jgi:hypothetical protein
LVPSSRALEDGTDRGVPKCWLLELRRRGITQKKKYHIKNTAKA